MQKVNRIINKQTYIWEREMECLPKVIPTKSCIIHCQSNHRNLIFLSTDRWSSEVSLFSFFCAPALVQNPLCDQLRKVQNLLSSKDHSSKLFEWENTKCGLACMHCSALWQCTMHLQCPSKCRKMQKYAEQSNCRVCTCSRWARASNSCWILWWNSLHVLRSPPPAKPPCSVECSLISSTCHY